MSVNQIILGIDPGLNGALAFIDDTATLLGVYKMPTTWIMRNRKRKRIIDDDALIELIDRHGRIEAAWLEDVYSSPQMGVTSSFTFGDGKGLLRGILKTKKIDVNPIYPSVWKRDMKCSANKKATKQRARLLFPNQTHMLTSTDKCEAALIALYGLLTLGVPEHIGLHIDLSEHRPEKLG